MKLPTTSRTPSTSTSPCGRDDVTERVLSASLDEAIAALPDAVDEAMRAALPHRYTPELAAQLAETMAAKMRQPNADGPLTPAQSIPAPDDGLGAWITAPVETTLRDIDDQCAARENEELPFLAAQMVVSDYRPQAYGRHTNVWLHYGRTTGTLTPAKAREVLAAMRDFTDQFEALLDLAEKTSVGDFEGDPEIARLDREAEDRRIAAVSKARSAALG